MFQVRGFRLRGDHRRGSQEPEARHPALDSDVPRHHIRLVFHHRHRAHHDVALLLTSKSICFETTSVLILSVSVV